MSSILFIEKKLRADKLGIMYLSKILKGAGHSVDMIQDDIDNADQYLQSNRVDFVMYSVFTGEHRWFINKNSELKKKHSFVSVMGGPHFTFFPEQGIDDLDIDYIVQGTGESVILDIVEGRTSNKLVTGHIQDNINTIPSPDRAIQYKYAEFGKSPIKRFIAGRDCQNSCKYCFNHLYHRLYKDEKHKFFQITSVDKIIQEIKDVRNEYGLELVYINDDDLARDHNWLLEFCDKYKKEINLPFCGSIRANSVNKEILETMKDAGCTFLNIALESSNPETQKMLRRGNITNKQVEDACTICNVIGIKVRLQNMIGLPVEDPLKDALETLEYNQRINPYDSWAAIFQPFPKTDIWYYCLEKKLIEEGTECMNFYEDTRLNIKDAEKINALHKWWYFIVKHNIPMDLVKILIDLPLTQQQKNTIQNLRWNETAKMIYKIPGCNHGR